MSAAAEAREARRTRRPVRVTIEGEGYCPAPGVLIVERKDGGKVCLPTDSPGVTVEDVVPPRVWTDGDVVQEVASDRVWRRIHREDGQHAWSNGFLALRTDHAVSALVARGDNRVLRYQAGEDR